MLPAVCLVYLCANVGPRGATRRSACPVLRHSESSPLGLSAQMWGRGVLPATLPAPFSATLSPALSVYLCVNVGPQGLLVVRLPAPLVPHSTSLGPSRATRVLSARCPSPPLLPVWMNVYFVFPWCCTPLPFDFLSVLVVRGGTVCLPTPPSWFSKTLHFKSSQKQPRLPKLGASKARLELAPTRVHICCDKLQVHRVLGCGGGLPCSPCALGL